MPTKTLFLHSYPRLIASKINTTVFTSMCEVAKRMAFSSTSMIGDQRVLGVGGVHREEGGQYDRAYECGAAHHV